MAFTPLPQQRLAIDAPFGPVLVVAGPGAGKTFCLIARINHLIETRGMAPERICAVTFTNRAAEEIALRLAAAGSEPRHDVNEALGVGPGHHRQGNVEVKYSGPDGVMVDVSETGWVGTSGFNVQM